jgi:N-acetyl-anhydromuramyl-L-alanine amidase AmpD
VVILNGVVTPDRQYVGYYDGMIHPGRAVADMGAHVQGHNEDTIGIVLVGLSGDFTHKQFSSSRWVVKQFMEDYNMPIEGVVGHCELDPAKKDYCPGFNMNHYREFINDYTKKHLLIKNEHGYL